MKFVCSWPYLQNISRIWLFCCYTDPNLWSSQNHNSCYIILICLPSSDCYHYHCHHGPATSYFHSFCGPDHGNPVRLCSQPSPSLPCFLAQVTVKAVKSLWVGSLCVCSLTCPICSLTTVPCLVALSLALSSTCGVLPHLPTGLSLPPF